MLVCPSKNSFDILSGLFGLKPTVPTIGVVIVVEGGWERR